MFRVLFLSLFFISCMPAKATTKVESNKVEGYDFKSQKIFIVAYDSEGSESIMRGISKRISEVFTYYRIENELHNETVNDLDFEPYFPREKVNDYKPDTILILAFDNGQFLNGGLMEFEMNSSLLDPIEGRMIWKSELKSEKTSGEGGIDNPDAINNMATEFIQKMWDDGLLDIDERPGLLFIN